MAIDSQGYTHNTVTFAERMRCLVDVVNTRLRDVLGREHRRKSIFLDRDNLRDMRHAYLLSEACRLIGEAGSVTMEELTRGLRIRKYTCARLANWMSDRGLAERGRDSKDRRVVRIWLTLKGFQLREAMDDALLQE